MGGRLLTGLAEVTSDVGALDTAGLWAVVLPYDAEPVCARFTESRPVPEWLGSGRWFGPARSAWRSSLDREGFVAGVETIRELIGAGEVYQVNLTRRLSAALDPRVTHDITALARVVALGNPAPHSAMIRLPDLGLQIVSASPERFLARRAERVWSSPIKGTAARPDGFLPKDTAENVMIVDLTRNDLGRICRWGSVEVTSLLTTEAHPGLYHLVSTVEGSLRPGIGWSEILDATFPPGSVTGAPKLAALSTIDQLEPVSRGPYCGSIGWVDADRGVGELNVAIRTFWLEGGLIHFGTGGGITHDSDPSGEWEETELKAARLVALASQTVA